MIETTIQDAFEQAITELAPLVGVKHACAAVGRPRATHYRRHRQSPAPVRPPREPRPQPRALSAAERAEVLAVLHEPRFVDLAPGEVHAILLDEGRYLCSESTMYRLLSAQHGQVRERRSSGHPPAAGQARARRTRTEPDLELGHHQAGRSGEVDLLLPVLDHRHLLALHRGLDGRHR